jgi:hypothetical protein
MSDTRNVLEILLKKIEDREAAWHAVSIVEASSTHLLVIDDGGPFSYTWSDFNYWYDVNGDDLYYAVTWA